MNGTETTSAGAGGLAGFIRARGEAILQRWTELVLQRVPVARGLSQPLLRDHMPDMLARLPDLLSQHAVRREPLEDLPTIHALERLDEGFDLQQVCTEYRMLRRAILEEKEAHGLQDADLREVVLLHDAIDKAITASVDGYVEARARTLVAIDRIAQVALGSATAVELEPLLPRLLTVLLETTAVVDSAAILLAEGDVLRVRAAVGAAHEGKLGTTLELGEGLAGAAAERREPLLTRDATNDPRINTNTINKEGTRALYAVPLLQGNTLIGVAMIGSRTAHEFSQEDLLLVRSMANRATSVIVQAQLRERAEQARQETERESENFRNLADNMSQLAWMADAHGEIFWFNRRWFDFTGTTLEQMKGSGWKATHHPQHLQRVVEKYRRHIESGIPWEDTFPLRGADGRYRWFLSRATPIRDAEGRITRWFGTNTDITDQRETLMALEESRARIQVLVQGARLGTFDRDLATGVSELNPIARDLFGLPAGVRRIPLEDLLGRVHQDDRASLQATLMRAQNDRANPSYEVTFRTTGADGRERWVTVRGRMTLDAEGNPARMSGVLLDVTDAKNEDEFRERFLGIVSHDLRNPLSTIRTSASLLQRAEEWPDKYRKTVSRIGNAADRMTRMIADLLDFTRGRLGSGIPVQRAAMNVRHLVRHLVDDLELAHPQRELTLEANGSFDGVWDQDRLAQLFTNLLENALRHGQAGAPVRVELDGARDDAVVIKVHNEGTPIPAALLPHIFDPFRRGGAQEREGLGLGLYIAQLIVQAHEGTISVESGETRGTAFTVTLPRGSRVH